jgi:hypothetical protein
VYLLFSLPISPSSQNLSTYLKPKKMRKLTYLTLGMVMVLTIHHANAQFTVDGQIIQRGEFRNGFGQLIAKDKDPAAFIAHRARLQALYEMENFTFYMSIQDVRTWGSTPQVKATDAYLSVHEAWAAAKIGENWQIKLGRQELNYDNYRFLGNLDWALQGRSHDFALVKYENEYTKIHFGGAFNQDGQAMAGNAFTTSNQYKTAQMFRYENKFDQFSLSFLFWNDGRQFLEKEPSGIIISQKLYHRQTIGFPTLRYQKGNSQFSGFYYQQIGKDPVGRKVNAYNFSVNFNHSIPLDIEKGKSISFVAGTEYLSGNSTNQTESNNSYSPLYGTNHLFNGYMDLFYVGGAHEFNVGVEDYYVKTRYAFSKKMFLQGDFHVFYSQGKVFSKSGNNPQSELDSFFGAEIDLSFGYVFNDAVSLQSGYSQFFRTDTFSYIQPNENLKATQNWAYLMLIFRPTMKNKFIGILL